MKADGWPDRWLALTLVAVAVGCGRGGPRSADAIAAEQLSLPVLYLTAEGEEVTAPANLSDVVIAPRSRRLAFRAYHCVNPDCPNRDRGGNGRPFLFAWPDPLWRIGDKGDVEYEVVEDRMGEIVKRGGTAEPTCPGCRTRRNVRSESAEERQRYRDWVVYYELPESAARSRQLDAEYRDRKGLGGKPADPSP